MRKFFKLFGLLVALVACSALQSCHKKGELLDYVPANASIVVYGDAGYLMENCGITDEGKIVEPLRSALEENGFDPSEHKKDLKIIKDFSTESVMFLSGQKIWFIFGLKDAGDFEKYLKNEQDFDSDKDSGVTILSKKGGSMMIKDKKLFLCINLQKGKPVEDVEGVKELCNLGGDSFAKSDDTKELAEKIKEEDHTIFAIANINKIAQLAEDEDFDQFKMGLSMVYKNPTYICADLTVNDEGIFATAKVLDSNYKPAECTLPTGKIDTSAFPYSSLPGSTALVAVDFPSELISQISNLAGKMLPPDALSLLKSINGTASASFDLSAKSYSDTWAVALSTNSNSDAMNLGDFIGQMDTSLKCSTSNQYLRIASRTAPAPSGKTDYAKLLKDKAVGAVIDLGASAKAVGLGGDFSDLGVATLYAEKVDKSLIFKFEWKCAKPINKIFTLISNAKSIENSIDAFMEKKYEQEERTISYYGDSTAYGYQPTYGYQEEYYEPEPDYLY